LAKGKRYGFCSKLYTFNELLEPVLELWKKIWGGWIRVPKARDSRRRRRRVRAPKARIEAPRGEKFFWILT